MNEVCLCTLQVQTQNLSAYAACDVGGNGGSGTGWLENHSRNTWCTTLAALTFSLKNNDSVGLHLASCPFA